MIRWSEKKESRVKAEAAVFLKVEDCTIRKLEHLNNSYSDPEERWEHVSKSTIHKDLTVCLKEINPTLYYIVREKLDKNLHERHIKGGMATKEKYAKK